MSRRTKPIGEQLEMIERWIGEAEKALRNRPEGMLVVAKRPSRTEWYLKTGEELHYLPKGERELAVAMAQASYAKNFLKEAEKVRRDLIKLQVLEGERSAGVMFRKLAEPYERLSEGRKDLVKPYVLPDEAFARAWEAVAFEGKPFSENAPEIYTEKGERVRSKSEKMIADRLHARGIHYRYEYPVFFRGVGTIWSDFTLLDLSEREEVVMEHFGLMDDPAYMKNALWKINVFGRNGFELGDRFLCTFESQSHPIDMKQFERMIAARFSLSTGRKGAFGHGWRGDAYQAAPAPRIDLRGGDGYDDGKQEES